MFMSFIDSIKEIKDKLLAKQVNSQSVEVSNIDKAPAVSWFAQSPHGVPRNVNIIELRQYAKSSWVQMVENAICKQISSIDFEIVPTDEEEEVLKYNSEIEEVDYLLRNPNRNKQTFYDVWGQYLRDVLELDAGVIWLGTNAKGKVVELFCYDASRFLIEMDVHGIVQKYWQYSYANPKGYPLAFDAEEIVYGKMNNSSEHYPYGFSPLQSIQQEVEVMIQSTRYNKEYFKNNAIPSGIVSAEMDHDSLTRLKNSWMNDIKGKAHKLLFINSKDVAFTNLNGTNKDMQWLDGQKWYFHLVFGAYGLSPQEVGFYENSNRATGESQERLTIKNAIKPYLKLIEDKINREIIPKVVGHRDIKFQWKLKDSVAEKLEHEQTIQKLQANVYTINEVRALEGKSPVEWGDKPMALFFQEQNSLKQSPKSNSKQSSKESQEPEDTSSQSDEESEEESEKKKFDEYLVKDVKGETDETKYDEFLKKKFRGWEQSVLKAIDSELKDNVLKSATLEKSFGNFLAKLFNSVNTTDFSTELQKVMTSNLKDGLQHAEKELNMDIGFTPQFGKYANMLTLRQLDGFYIEGEKWPGLRGVAKDLQDEIMHSVSEGIVNNIGQSKIKKNVQEIFNKYTGTEMTEGRATKIARTESTRVYNMGKLTAYKESGLKGKKVWDAFMDDKTSDICKELNGQAVPLNEDFVLSNGQRFDAPPGHCSCRSCVRLELE
jgi:HK97 family phage portal protein